MVTSNAGDNHRGRGGRGRFTKRPATAERDAQAARLRADGSTYQQIADQLGFSHRDLARRSVQRALAATVREPADELRQLEMVRLDALWVEATKVMTAEHLTVSHGKVVEVDGVPLKDDGPVLSAIDRLLKIMERRAKLVGLDAPAKVQVMSLDAIDAEIEQLSAELGRTAASETAATEGSEAAEG